ncbi:hypothetical protein CYMTET_45735 [Cymbomonas tetramitiformis]|uniref:Uncharacterized protein n=1 Tax=Cymbomonas tetramitiformis TaxID=36881 RepID=A0AAE0BZN3_9CHLO|nr:hypothetical protein CYMTET_45735 [Cymbomonas tetramitiformis]
MIYLRKHVKETSQHVKALSPTASTAPKTWSTTSTPSSSAGHQRRRQRALSRCLLAGGKTEIISDFSARSFDVSEDIEDGMVEYLQDCQPVDASMGGFTVGGTAHDFAFNTFAHDAAAHLRITGGGWISIETEGPQLALNRVHVETDADDDGNGSDTVSAPDDDGVPPAECPYAPARGCGKPPLGLGRSTVITLLICALFCVCATTAPLTGFRLDVRRSPKMG